MDQLVRRATTHGRAHMNSYGAMPAPKQSKASDLTLFSVGEVPRVQCQTGSLFLCVGSKRRPSRERVHERRVQRRRTNGGKWEEEGEGCEL